MSAEYQEIRMYADGKFYLIQKKISQTQKKHICLNKMESVFFTFLKTV